MHRGDKLSDTIVFKKIKKGTIYSPEFLNLRENNGIVFSSCGIAVIYGPNGAGKTTLTKILSSEAGTEFELSYKNITYSSTSTSPFHVISDHLGRNIISGSAGVFFRREH